LTENDSETDTTLLLVFCQLYALNLKKVQLHRCFAAKHRHQHLNLAAALVYLAHFAIEAPPVLTQDTRELAEDVGTTHQYEAHAKNQSTTSRMVGRFNAHTKVAVGETIDVAVDTSALHFFDVETGLGIYDGAE